MLRPQPVKPPGYQPGGDLIRQWSQHRVRAAIEATTTAIRQALHRGDVELAFILVSRNVGLRICAGEINPRLRPPPRQI